MKPLRQQHSSHRLKGWASLDCLLTSLPITPLSRSSIMMRSSDVLQMTDTRRLSPQTTTSSGYHSDLSSTNESPQSTHGLTPVTAREQSPSSQIQKKTIDNKSSTNKNLSRISSFIRKQYERAKSKLIPTKPLPPVITTSTKATSTTPLSHLTENNYTKQSTIYQQSSFIEPVYSVYVRPLYDHRVQIPPKNYASIHECYSHQPSHRPLSYSKINHNQVNSHHSYRRGNTMVNHGNTTTGYLSNNNTHRQHYYSVKPSSYQSSYPYRYRNNNRSSYPPSSDFISTKNSAFQPIKKRQFHQRPLCHLYEQVPPSDDPCDLEVAQYFHQTSQWSNPNYFDIYTKKIFAPRQNYTETLC